MIKNLSYLSIGIILFILCGLLWAEDDKVDEILDRTKETGKKVDVLYEQYKNDPLADKTWGIEFNFVRLLAQTKDSSTLSGGFSYFGKPLMEIYVPWYYYKYDGESYFHYVNGTDNVFYTDARVRIFTGNSSNGFFLSALSRFAYLSTKKHDYDSTHENSTIKWGIGFGIGWRTFSYRGFYWGCSLSVGRYFTGEIDILMNDTTSLLYLEEATNDHRIFYDLEFLKFGYAF